MNMLPASKCLIRIYCPLFSEIFPLAPKFSRSCMKKGSLSQSYSVPGQGTIKMPSSESKAVLKFCKLSEKAYAPTKGSEAAAGYDLRSAYKYEIEAGGKALVMTDIQIAVPEGCYGRVAPRSGLAWKNHIDVGAGVIDIDYRGNVGVVLFNHGKETFLVNPGDRVAQLICERIEYPEIEEVKDLTETVRGTGGFGSTGIN